jgi:hypothetical protein
MLAHVDVLVVPAQELGGRSLVRASRKRYERLAPMLVVLLPVLEFFLDAFAYLHA